MHRHAAVSAHMLSAFTGSTAAASGQHVSVFSPV